jgi:hypothetical protein
LRRARRLQDAGKPVPAHLRAQSVLGLRGAIIVGAVCLLVGLVSCLQDCRSSGGRGLAPLGDLVDNWWGVGAFAWIVAGTTVIAVGASFDPSKGRPRCPKCWYDVESMLNGGRWRNIPARSVPRMRATDSKSTRAPQDTQACRADPHRAGHAALRVLHARDASNDPVRRDGAHPDDGDDRVDELSPDSMLIEPSLQQRWVAGNATEDALLGRIDDPRTWRWQRRWFHEQVAQAWDRPQSVRDLRVAMATRWGDSIEPGYCFTGKCSAGWPARERRDIQEIATEMLSGGVYRGEAGARSHRPSREGRTTFSVQQRHCTESGSRGNSSCSQGTSRSRDGT